MQLITVCTFSDVTEAYIVKGRLENEGVPCYIMDENISVLRPSLALALALGGIKLQVEASQVEKALAILKETQ